MPTTGNNFKVLFEDVDDGNTDKCGNELLAQN